MELGLCLMGKAPVFSERQNNPSLFRSVARSFAIQTRRAVKENRAHAMRRSHQRPLAAQAQKGRTRSFLANRGRNLVRGLSQRPLEKRHSCSSMMDSKTTVKFQSTFAGPAVRSMRTKNPAYYTRPGPESIARKDQRHAQLQKLCWINPANDGPQLYNASFPETQQQKELTATSCKKDIRNQQRRFLCGADEVLPGNCKEQSSRKTKKISKDPILSKSPKRSRSGCHGRDRQNQGSPSRLSVSQNLVCKNKAPTTRRSKSAESNQIGSIGHVDPAKRCSVVQRLRKTCSEQKTQPRCSIDIAEEQRKAVARLIAAKREHKRQVDTKLVLEDTKRVKYSAVDIEDGRRKALLRVLQSKKEMVKRAAQENAGKGKQKRGCDVNIEAVIQRAQLRVRERKGNENKQQQAEAERERQQRTKNVDVEQMARLARDRARRYKESNDKKAEKTKVDIVQQRLQLKQARAEQKKQKKQRRAEIYAMNKLMMAWNMRKMKEYHKGRVAEEESPASATPTPVSSEDEPVE